MPKHAFKFPREVTSAVKAYVERAIRSIDPCRFEQESQYTTSLITRLEGTAYQGELGFVRFDVTAMNDRGRSSAESIWGTDFALTATVSDGQTTIEKAILMQAKLGLISEMTANKRAKLKEQIQKMRRVTNAPKVMEIPSGGLFRDPRVISGLRILQDHPYRPLRLPEYIASRVTTTLDGTTNTHIVSAVAESSLKQLKITAKFL